MGKLAEKLTQAGVIGLDTSIFMYHFENNARFRTLTDEILAGVESCRWRAVTSVITLLEFAVRPFQLEKPAVAREYEALLVHFPNLEIVEIDRETARRAAQLRARYGVGAPDALQVAAGLQHGVHLFVTNDRALTKLAPVAEVCTLEEYVETG